MSKKQRKLAVALLAFAAGLACLPYILAGQQRTTRTPAPAGSQTVAQDIESKLSRKADFIPGSKPAVDQLIAVAQHYRIPMGIELAKKSDSTEFDVALPGRNSGATVRDLLQTIVSRMPGYQMTVENGIAHVTDPVLAADAGNFLNIRIDEFRVYNQNLLDAEEDLRLTIDATLHPDDYQDGYVGSHGNDPDDVFAKRYITYASEDLSVREILDGLTKASGNALWVAQLNPDNFKQATTSTDAKPAGNSKQEGPKSKYRWKFVPFVDKPSIGETFPGGAS